MHSSVVKKQPADVNVVENAMIQLHYCPSTAKYLKLANTNEAKNQLNHMLKSYLFSEVTANMGEQRVETDYGMTVSGKTER